MHFQTWPKAFYTQIRIKGYEKCGKGAHQETQVQIGKMSDEC
jgi:hypothetical protein